MLCLCVPECDCNSMCIVVISNWTTAKCKKRIMFYSGNGNGHHGAPWWSALVQKTWRLHWGVLVCVFTHVCDVWLYMLWLCLCVIVRFSAGGQGFQSDEIIWGQRVLWAFNEAVCIHTGLAENRPLEHLRKSSFKLSKKLPQIFHMTQRLKNGTFNHRSVTISRPLKCQNP